MAEEERLRGREPMSNDPPESTAWELREIEQSLRSLTLRPGRLDRERLMFLAGQFAAARELCPSGLRHWAWPAATLASTTAAIVLAALLVVRPGPQVIQPEPRIVREIVYVERPAPPTAAAEREERPSEAEPVAPDEGPDAAPVRPEHAVAGPRRMPVPDVLPPRPADDERSLAFSRPSYLQLRQMVLARGIEALPEPPRHGGGFPSGPATWHELRGELLGSERLGVW